MRIPPCTAASSANSCAARARRQDVGQAPAKLDGPDGTSHAQGSNEATAEKLKDLGLGPILLDTGGAQTCQAMAVDRALPTQIFLNSKGIAVARFLEAK
jgi:hypothetical protein